MACRQFFMRLLRILNGGYSYFAVENQIFMNNILRSQLHSTRKKCMRYAFFTRKKSCWNAKICVKLRTFQQFFGLKWVKIKRYVFHVKQFNGKIFWWDVSCETF